MDYVYDRAHLLQEHITESQARELFREAAGIDGSELAGDLDSGFSFWAIVTRDGPNVTKLIRCDVTPCPIDPLR